MFKSTLESCHNFPAGSREAARVARICETSLLNHSTKLGMKKIHPVASRDIGSAKSGLQCYQIWQLSVPWASPYVMMGKWAWHWTSIGCTVEVFNGCNYSSMLGLKQSGTKPNLVAKFWLPTLVFFVIYVMFSEICSMWVYNNVIKYCGWGILHDWDMSFGKFWGLPTVVAFPENWLARPTSSQKCPTPLGA